MENLGIDNKKALLNKDPKKFSKRVLSIFVKPVMSPTSS